MEQQANKARKPSQQFIYYANWFLQQTFGHREPLINTMILHLVCNLSCEHCDAVHQKERTHNHLKLSYETVKEKLSSLYNRGARVAYFEGGEPTLWKDGEKNLSDIILLAKEIGYFTTGYTTNGTGEIFTDSDVISVSLDGPKEVHDKIRAPGSYQLLMKNLEKVNHGNIFANMTISKSNINYVAETVQLVQNHPKISGIMLNFVTPPPDALMISTEERSKVIQLILALKKQGSPVVNTTASLKQLANPDFSTKCPRWMSVFVLPDGTETAGCPLQSDNACHHCGFDAVREYSLITKGHVPSLWEISRRFAFSKPKK